ncbi:MAG: hypothetical protein V2B19_16445 [Pseudomonadota bacterium]
MSARTKKIIITIVLLLGMGSFALSQENVALGKNQMLMTQIVALIQGKTNSTTNATTEGPIDCNQPSNHICSPPKTNTGAQTATQSAIIKDGRPENENAIKKN